MDFVINDKELRNLQLQATFNGDNLWRNAEEPLKILSQQELLRIMSALENRNTLHTHWGEWLRQRNVAVCMTIYLLGCRPREGCHIKFSDILKDSKGNWSVYIQKMNNKQRKARVIPVTKQLLNIILKYLELPKHFWNNSEYLFPSFADKSRPMSSQRLKTIWREVCKDSGCYIAPEKEIGERSRRNTLYSLRRTKAVEMLEKSNGNTFLVASLLGHANLRSIGNYVKCTSKYKDLMREVMEQPIQEKIDAVPDSIKEVEDSE